MPGPAEGAATAPQSPQGYPVNSKNSPKKMRDACPPIAGLVGAIILALGIYLVVGTAASRALSFSLTAGGPILLTAAVCTYLVKRCQNHPRNSSKASDTTLKSGYPSSHGNFHQRCVLTKELGLQWFSMPMSSTWVFQQEKPSVFSLEKMTPVFFDVNFDDPKIIKLNKELTNRGLLTLDQMAIKELSYDYPCELKYDLVDLDGKTIKHIEASSLAHAHQLHKFCGNAINCKNRADETPIPVDNIFNEISKAKNAKEAQQIAEHYEREYNINYVRSFLDNYMKQAMWHKVRTPDGKYTDVGEKLYISYGRPLVSLKDEYLGFKVKEINGLVVKAYGELKQVKRYTEIRHMMHGNDPLKNQ